MSYCAIENVLRDIDELIDYIREGKKEELNEYELQSAKHLIEYKLDEVKELLEDLTDRIK